MSKINQANRNVKKKLLFAIPPLGRYSSRKEWEDACWQKIVKSRDLFAVLVTSSERHNLVMRAVAIDRVNSGKKYRQIAEELWLSPQTISSIKKVMNGSNYKSYRERGKTERRKKVYTPSPASSRRKRRRRQVRTKYGIVYPP